MEFSGYFHIHIDLEQKATFTCPFGTFAYRRMVFGLYNAPNTFQQYIVSTIFGFTEHCMKVLMNDFYYL